MSRHRAFLLSILLPVLPVCAQSLGSAGTVEGVVLDATGAGIPGARVRVTNPVTSFDRHTLTAGDGSYRLTNLPPNQYHLRVEKQGFEAFNADVAVRSTVPMVQKITLAVGGLRTEVRVEAAGEDLIENVPHAHTDVGQAHLAKLPLGSPAAQLSDAITLNSPGVVADSNGFFHPLGDHAQVSFSIDGQPIGDQQSKQFSTQLPVNAIESMELITGAPSAEFGDKTSLVVNAITKSGLGRAAHGSLHSQYGSFGTAALESTLGVGTKKFGAFFSANALRSGRFLDTPEFRPIHAIGNSGTFFSRLDYQPGGPNVYHVNLFGARNWFQVPNTFDQKLNDQDQRQKAETFSASPGYQRTLSPRVLLTVNPFVRHDVVNYYPSRDGERDTPVTIGQRRTLTNWGVKGDLAYVRGAHNIKVGAQVMQTRLDEAFRLGITDPDFIDKDEQPGLLPFDLTRGGRLFQFAGRANINQQAFFLHDAMRFGRLNVTAGLRVDHYRGLATATGVQPRLGASYAIAKTSTVFRAAYSRTFETPYNENLVLASSTGSGGLATNVFGAFGAKPVEPGRRNQFNAGLQQAIHRFLVVDADYFWKYTANAYDFGVLLNSPIAFPLSWRQSKIDGLAVRIATTNWKGFQAFNTMGHSRARFFGPSNGGLLFNSPLETGVFRIDHDQAFQQTTHVRYQYQRNGPFVAFTWRYDSGLVAGAVAGLDDALALTAAEQTAIGFFCGGTAASWSRRITQCSGNFGATRLRIPAEGTEDADHNPPRIAPRHLFSIAGGTDNLFRSERVRTTLRVSVGNAANRQALYNFQSTFAGTHFVAPRTVTAELGWVF
jgi:hypothetical protein